jgi:hypothetical protein
MLKSKLVVGMGILVVAGLALCRPSVARADSNLLTNGDFEAGNTGFTSGYAYTPGNIYGENTYDVVSNPHDDHPLANSYGDHTTGSGLMLALNGDTSSNVAAWSETVQVTAGNEYDFDGFLSSWSQGYGPIARLELVINGTDIGEADAPAAGGVWSQFSDAWNAGAATSATITLYDLETAASGNDFSLDDLSFSQNLPLGDTNAAPAPASGMAALIGFAGIAAMKLRRREMFA